MSDVIYASPVKWPPIRQLAILLEDFALQSPAQQLLDRFLVGYRLGDFFRRNTAERVVAHLAGPLNEELARRVADHGLVLANDVAGAVRSADAILIVPRHESVAPSEAVVREALTHARRGAGCFVYGATATNLAAARTLSTLGFARQIRLASGTELSIRSRLPDVELSADALVDQTLVVVQGPSPHAEFHALDALLPSLERRAGDEHGVRQVKFLSGRDLWRAGDRREWSWDLLAAALSRSDSPQGDAITDGRTQDLVSLGLVPKLATNPRGWLLDHFDGARTVVLDLAGVVADYNFAMRLADGSYISAQIFRASAPGREHFNLLVSRLEQLFRTGHTMWSPARSWLTAGLLDACRQTAMQPGVWLRTPELIAR